MKKYFGYILIFVAIITIGIMAHRIIMLDSQINDLREENKSLYEGKENLKMQLNRERKRQDDLRDSTACPICNNSQIEKLRYGIVYSNCLYDPKTSKRYACSKCGYKWGIDGLLSEKETHQKSDSSKVQ